MNELEALIELIKSMSDGEIVSELIMWLEDNDDESITCMSDVIDSMYRAFDEERARGVENAE